MIAESVAKIREEISDAAKKSGRDPAKIKLIGVTKTVDTARIKELFAAGVREIGENRVQDFVPKYDMLQNESAEWHFIGHLQRNKVKFVVERASLIQSVDSEALAKEINRHGEKIGKEIQILAEVNISGEASKFGVSPDEIFKFVENLANMRFVRLRGLMTVAPFVENAEENRAIFAKARNLLLDINSKSLYHCQLEDISMGMSQDFPVAIEEGATMVRIGTALFGER